MLGQRRVAYRGAARRARARDAGEVTERGHALEGDRRLGGPGHDRPRGAVPMLRDRLRRRAVGRTVHHVALEAVADCLAIVRTGARHRLQLDHVDAVGAGWGRAGNDRPARAVPTFDQRCRRGEAHRNTVRRARARHPAELGDYTEKWLNRGDTRRDRRRDDRPRGAVPLLHQGARRPKADGEAARRRGTRNREQQRVALPARARND